MKGDSMAAVFAMSLMFTSPAVPRKAAADLYIEIEGAVVQGSGDQTVDVIVGNRGTAVSRENFDATLEVESKGRTLCRSTTNFITPIGPGQSIRALRFELRPAETRSVEPYTVRGSIRYWDRTRSGTQRETSFALLQGRGRCIALKPVQ